MPPRDAHNIWNKGLDEECGEDSDGKVSSYKQLRMGRTFSPTTAASLSTRAHLFVETDLIAEHKAFRSSLPDSLPRNTFISKTELEMSATHSLDRGFCSTFYYLITEFALIAISPKISPFLELNNVVD